MNTVQDLYSGKYKHISQKITNFNVGKLVYLCIEILMLDMSSDARKLVFKDSDQV